MFLGVAFGAALCSFHSATVWCVAILYAFLVLNIHTTIFVHRYSAHKAFVIPNRTMLFILQNLVIKVIPEEIFVISHYVHHKYPDQLGDPYFAGAGWLYCFLADFNHQLIRRNLAPEDYKKISELLNHTTVHQNSYQQYLRFGSVSHPLLLLMTYLANWGFWFFVFSMVGGIGFAWLMFAMAFLWLFSIRNFNFKAHGGGIDKRKPGVDFCKDNLSLNRPLPGLTAGEWHSHHHLYPRSCRYDFLPGQIDLSWYVISFMHKIGIITSTVDNKKDFISMYRTLNQ